MGAAPIAIVGVAVGTLDYPLAGRHYCTLLNGILQEQTNEQGKVLTGYAGSSSAPEKTTTFPPFEWNTKSS